MKETVTERPQMRNDPSDEHLNHHGLVVDVEASRVAEETYIAPSENGDYDPVKINTVTLEPLSPTSPFYSKFRKRNFSLGLQTTRDLRKRSPDYTSKQLRQIIEAQNLSQMKERGVPLKPSLTHEPRCPRCAVVPPCKHYEDSSQITTHDLVHHFSRNMHRDQSAMVIRENDENNRVKQVASELQRKDSYREFDPIAQRRLENRTQLAAGFLRQGHGHGGSPPREPRLESSEALKVSLKGPRRHSTITAYNELSQQPSLARMREQN